MNVNRRKLLSGAALVPVAAGVAACTITPEELTELRAQESSLPEP
ncbi:MAG: twin-arginine translocation signal domain-containing protein [Caldilineaceae bacterium SB0662_bin_9]|uniref:Twin-arginine translocation signal domain-containing protein n=1 Tax=Caldilineaceae bacterium SB0662_bin_9 TaxID=2605258 RepID=A0A6B1DXJ6_9CHLR|nr:twin-arginine translocation signal domain-containing protein [Caldilineaceae bacterium SB0662_bin_9]